VPAPRPLAPVPLVEPDVPVPVVSVLVEPAFFPRLVFLLFVFVPVPLVSSVPDAAVPAVPDVSVELVPDVPLRRRVEVPPVPVVPDWDPELMDPEPLPEVPEEPVPVRPEPLPDVPPVCANINGNATTVTSIDISTFRIPPPCWWNFRHETLPHVSSLTLTVTWINIL
jgi:hypothetical protein